MFGKGAPRCRRCAGAVYAAEEVIGAGQKWHTQCFSCKECKTRLSSTTLTEKEGEIYCTSDLTASTSAHRGQQQPHASVRGSLSPNSATGLDVACASARGTLQPPDERRLARLDRGTGTDVGATAATTGESVGAALLLLPALSCSCCTSSSCDLSVDSASSLLVCHARCVVSSTCYAKNFGPKGYGIGGTGVLTGVSVADGQGAKPASSSASSPAGAGAGSAGGAFCTSCGQKNETSSKFCGGCGKPTGGAAAAAASSPRAAAAPAAAAAAPAPASGNFAANKPIARPSFQAANTASTKCGKCALTVYEAEKVVGGGRVWHQACYRCTTCRTGLNSTNLNDKEGQIYCNACYAKNFGPKGFGFSGGGATMHTQ